MLFISVPDTTKLKVNVNKNQKTKKLVVIKLNVIRSVDIGEEVRIRVRAKAGVTFREG